MFGLDESNNKLCNQVPTNFMSIYPKHQEYVLKINVISLAGNQTS